MAGRPTRTLVLVGRLFVLILTPKGGGLPCGGAFQFFDSILEFPILFAKLVDQLRLGSYLGVQRDVVRLKLLELLPKYLIL